MVVVFPAPFGPEEAEDLALLHAEVHVDDAQVGSVELGELLGLDDGHPLPPEAADPWIEPPHRRLSVPGSTSRSRQVDRAAARSRQRRIACFM